MNAVDSPYLTVAEAAAYLKFPSVKAFHHWRYRHESMPVQKRGRTLLFDRRVLDAAIDPKRGLKLKVSA